MKNKYIAIILLFALAVLLRSLYLDKGFFGDEAITLRSATVDLGNIIPTLVKVDAHPPLTAVLLHFWMKISQNEIFVRYYFIFFGIGVLWVMYLIAWEYLKNARFALLVLFLGAISPLLISLSQFIRNYVDSAFWMLLSNYFLLLIVRGKDNRYTWFGYLISSLLSIYTFYFSAIIILSQSVYIFIFKLRKWKIIKKWIIAQIAILLLFTPWVPYFMKQSSNTDSSKFLHWEKYGFKFARLDLGIYVRNISSLFGFDYLFMTYPEGIVKHFGLFYLLFISCGAFVLLSILLFYAIKWLSKEFRGYPQDVWFLPSLSLLPLLISWLSSKFTGVLPNSRYLAVPHAMFIMLISYFFYRLISRHKKSGILMLSSFIILYALRLPMAVTPAYEGKKAIEYLEQKIKNGDCIVMADRLPGSENLPTPLFNIENFIFERDPLTSRHCSLPKSKREGIKNDLKQFKRIWFIRCYGNTELFGGNQLIYDFLRSCGRKEVLYKEFNNIKLILME